MGCWSGRRWSKAQSLSDSASWWHQPKSACIKGGGLALRGGGRRGGAIKDCIWGSGEPGVMARPQLHGGEPDGWSSQKLEETSPAIWSRDRGPDLSVSLRCFCARREPPEREGSGQREQGQTDMTDKRKGVTIKSSDPTISPRQRYPFPASARNRKIGRVTSQRGMETGSRTETAEMPRDGSSGGRVFITQPVRKRPSPAAGALSTPRVSQALPNPVGTSASEQPPPGQPPAWPGRHRTGR